MIRRFAVLVAALGAVHGSGGVAATANAAPDDGSIRCNFTLSAPSVITVSGTQMVTATVSPADCTGTANPKASQVCIATFDSVGRCDLASGYETAQVFFSPYVPGTNYIAKGYGCAGLSTPSTAICSSVGPKAGVL
ncbi:hypothetical protein BH09ACT7_BH09ACT7_46090 [soil metagenome]